MNSPPKSRKSPCIKVCEMNPDTGLCSGCFRTLQEIAIWSSMTELEKDKVYLEIEKRKYPLAEQ